MVYATMARDNDRVTFYLKRDSFELRVIATLFYDFKPTRNLGLTIKQNFNIELLPIKKSTELQLSDILNEHTILTDKININEEYDAKIIISKKQFYILFILMGHSVSIHITELFKKIRKNIDNYPQNLFLNFKSGTHF